MTEKRFFIDTVDGGGSVLSDDGVPLLLYEVCGLLNELHEENQLLKREGKRRDKILDVFSDLEKLEEWKREDLLNALDEIAVIVMWQTEYFGNRRFIND